MAESSYYAHSLPGRPVEDWQGLRYHLDAVAERAGGFAAEFDAAEWGRIAGSWHDVGKYSRAFQEYLRSASDPDSHCAEAHGRIDHSSVGAQHATESFGVPGHLLAFVIAGHHSGLLDARSDGPSLEKRLQKAIESWSAAPSDLLALNAPSFPPALSRAFGQRDGFSVSFFTRMIFSCLVDGDFLDTERFMNPDRSAGRATYPEGILGRMEEALDRFIGPVEDRRSGVCEARSDVRRACREAAALEQGFFSLTVPTGGGKTLSSLAFALRHAVAHGLSRIIYVVPFTTIIEQNAEVFRRVFADLRAEVGQDIVIEHHSNLDPGAETTANRLASENWDAPLVVTTSVQFYESLFANRTSRCRKLHNLVGSVIILDEAQKLPVTHLEPCLRALKELCGNYRASVVLCTATQPAVGRRADFPIGLDSVREIVPDPGALARRLERVRTSNLGELPDDVLAQRLMSHERVLCVVNTRGHARQLFDRIGDGEGHFHLSASMCPEHRSVWLGRIRERLLDRRITRVVTTQLIEAGVDIDFPFVYRSMAGLDSIAQAAGRCNREGSLPEGGQVFVFTPNEEQRSRERFLRDTTQVCAQVLPLYPHNPLSLEAVEHYFRLYYWEQSDLWDAHGVLGDLKLSQERALPFLFGFNRIGQSFRLIEDARGPVIVPWGAAGERLCEEARRSPFLGRHLLRKLQRYTVSIQRRVWADSIGREIELVHDMLPLLLRADLHYSDATGLDLHALEGALLMA